MMDDGYAENAAAIAARIPGYFDQNHRLAFWEDEEGGYEELLDSISLKDIRIVNATHKELAAKRMVLRDCKYEQFLIYRSGGAPEREDDFLLDVKLAAVPFSVKTESIWAEECEIDPKLAPDLGIHGRFFASKERRERLANTKLPKSTLDELQFAMMTICADVVADTPTDAMRDTCRNILFDLASGKDESYQRMCNCALQTTFWAQVSRLVGYAPKDSAPTLEDFAYHMMEAYCAALLPEDTSSLTSEAIRIMDSVRNARRKRDAYCKLVERFGPDIVAEIPESHRTVEYIGREDALPNYDQWILIALLDALDAETLMFEDAKRVVDLRKGTYWYQDSALKYKCILSATHFMASFSLFNKQLASANSASEIFDKYCDSWYEVDRAYRLFCNEFSHLSNGRFKTGITQVRERILTRYNKFLIDLTDKWQYALCITGESYPPMDIPSQNHFFHNEVLHKLPTAERGNRVAVIISDAFRYELGQELTSQLMGQGAQRHKKLDATCAGMLCMLPSYTQLGMAALLPEGSIEIDASTGMVEKGGVRTDGLKNRQKLLQARVPESVAVHAKTLLDSGPTSLPDNAPVIYVYHDAIDAAGKPDTEQRVFAACDEACDEIGRLVDVLVDAGCGTVLVTADHGFIYQVGELESYLYVEVPNLTLFKNVEGFGFTYTRRYIIAEDIPVDEMIVAYGSEDLSLEGSTQIGLPKGISRLRLKGSSTNYVHGGASLQEDVVPVVTITTKKRGDKVEPTGVQGFMTGRPAITGSAVTLDVYQTEPIGENVTPLDVKIGLYAPGKDDKPGKLLSVREMSLTLASEDMSSENRKTRVTLEVTNDVDKYQKVFVHILRRVGQSSKYRSVWKQEYMVNRGFGHDF